MTNDILYITWDEFEQGAKDIARQVARHMHDNHIRFTTIYGVPRGGLVLAVRLSYLLGIPLLHEPNKITTTTLVVDDSTVTGKTLKNFCNKYNNKTAVFVHKPDTSIFTPDFICKTTTKTVNYSWEAYDDRN